MFENKNKSLVKANNKIANIFKDTGNAKAIADYLYYDKNLPGNFLLSGITTPENLYPILAQFIYSVIGSRPVIILHNGDTNLENLVRQQIQQNENVAAYIINAQEPYFEPFYGMTDMQIVSVCKRFAEKLKYTVTPRFERVVKAYLRILRELDIPASLSGLYYLCGFDDMGEFYDNIMQLPCCENTVHKIWADLGVGNDEQFDLLRSVIENFADVMQKCGWNADKQVEECNCLQAIKDKAVLMLSLSNLYADWFLSYLLEELKPFVYSNLVLLFVGVQISNDELFEYLCQVGPNCCIGLVSTNVLEQLSGNKEKFFRLADKMDCLTFFKHQTGETASVLSQIFGNHEHFKTDVSRGYSQSYTSIMPIGSQQNTHYFTENRSRVMPEDILALGPEQAIIFDTLADQIIYFDINIK